MSKQKSRSADNDHPSRIVDVTLVASAIAVLVFALENMFAGECLARLAQASGLCG
jgi:hypothetical protein